MNDKKNTDTTKRNRKGLRITVNSIMMIAIIGSSALTGYTVSNLGGGNSNTSTTPQMGQMSQMGERPDNSNNSSSENSTSGRTRPGHNSGSTDDSESDTESGSENTPPDMPSGDNNTDGGTPPDMPSGDNNTDGGTPPDMPSDGNFPGSAPNGASESGTTTNSGTELSVGNYLAFAAESLVIATLAIYLIASDFNHKAPKEVFSDATNALTLILSIIVATGVLFGIEILLVNTL